ncbi:hypothetical protein [Vibrio owensii]|uniref:hypothetical protein n=1 Tax=Vibrio owensii TaxID=696485 RepID=UPI0018F13A21|nr:hypothetical protein [Vibrio owensii]
MIDKKAFFPEGLIPVSVRVNTSSFKKSWSPKDYGVPVHIDRAIGSTGNFKLLGDEYGLEFRRVRETLYGAMSNVGLKVGEYLWLVPEGKSWEEAKTSIQKATNDMRSLKSKLRREYPMAIEDYAAHADKKLQGVGALIREKAYDWSYLEQRLQVVVQTTYQDSAKAKVFEVLSERIGYCLGKLTKGDSYKISKYTDSQLQSIVDWCSGMSVYEPSLELFAGKVQVVQRLLPESVRTSEKYEDVSQKVASCLLALQSTVLDLQDETEGSIVKASGNLIDFVVEEPEPESEVGEELTKETADAFLAVFA